jgi:hypothetical protein
VPGKDILLPIFNPIHSPLTREATARFQIMARKLMEACFEQRMRLEPELTPHLPVVEYTEEELHRIAEKAGFKLPPDIGEAS